MIKIKKTSLVLILVLSLLVGALGICTYLGLTIQDFRKGVEPTVRVPQSVYNDLVYYRSTYQKLDILRGEIKNNYYIDVSDEELDDAMFHGVFDCLDNYSMYYNPEEYEEDLLNSTGLYSGVGMTISYDDTGYIVVVSPTKGSPAYNAGIQTGDYILAVDGVEYTGENLSQCAQSMRGQAGTTVVVTIRRKDVIQDYSLVRADIVMESVEYEMLEDSLGYIQVSQFMSDTAEEFSQALKDVEAQGAKGLIIDLRSNGGGIVDESVDIADLLMDKATVIYTENRSGDRKYYTTQDGRTELPYVILVNGGTASASEILCAGVQDNEEGTIIGSQTFGKGIIQQAYGFGDGSGLQMTVQQYFSPKGNPIHQIGITPDYVVDLTEDCFDEDGLLVEDIQLDKAKELLTK